LEEDEERDDKKRRLRPSEGKIFPDFHTFPFLEDFLKYSIILTNIVFLACIKQN
jgi:hypothetical protein